MLAAALAGCSHRPAPRPAPAPAPVAADHPPALPPLTRQEAQAQTRRCLHTLADTGASPAALAEAQALAARLGTDPVARTLNAVLACRVGQDNRLPHSTLPTALAERAAAACAMQAGRKPGEIILSFAGDCTFGTVNGDGGPPRFPAVYRQARELDYPFALVQPWLRTDDLSVVNFECTLTNAVQTADKQWHFKGPARYANIFPAGSVDAVGLSNNHSHDYLQAGFDDTAANFKRANVPAFYQNTPYVTTVHGVPIVLIGDCTVVGENTTQIGMAPERVLAQIKHYKKPGTLVIVVMHWGSELDTTPLPWQQAMGHEFIDAGADAVVGHHPHVVQGIEKYKGRTIAYSLGNFAFGGNSRASRPDTFLWRLRFRTTDGTVTPAGALLVPCWITSMRAVNTAGVLENNYQTRPLFGAEAARTLALVKTRSAGLTYGLTQLDTLKLTQEKSLRAAN